MAFWQAFLGPLFMLPFWLPEINGYSKIYHNVDDYGVPYLLLSIVLFTLFSDCLIYFIHRGMSFNSNSTGFHHPSVYSWLHKPHHTWKIATPFSGFAFHPLDGISRVLIIRIRSISPISYLSLLLPYAGTSIYYFVCGRSNLDV
jgi:sterol desaturase/sphingolipid hydroxylase (fatty acid hydroxylase superfamily)